MGELKQSTRAEFMCAVEMRLRHWGFKGEVWTDGIHLTIDDKVVAPDFEIGKIREVLKDLTCHSGLSVDAEMVAGVVDEIAHGMDLSRTEICHGCSSKYEVKLNQRHFFSDSRCLECKERQRQVFEADDDYEPGRYEGEFGDAT